MTKIRNVRPEIEIVECPYCGAKGRIIFFPNGRTVERYPCNCNQKAAELDRSISVNLKKNEVKK